MPTWTLIVKSSTSLSSHQTTTKERNALEKLNSHHTYRKKRKKGGRIEMYVCTCIRIAEDNTRILLHLKRRRSRGHSKGREVEGIRVWVTTETSTMLWNGVKSTSILCVMYLHLICLVRSSFPVITRLLLLMLKKYEFIFLIFIFLFLLYIVIDLLLIIN